jgi:hypothetical protein
MRVLLKSALGNSTSLTHFSNLPRKGEWLNIVDNDGKKPCAKRTLRELLAGLNGEYAENISPLWEVVDVTYNVIDYGDALPVVCVGNEAW